MPKKPEDLGKGHEYLTEKLLNGAEKPSEADIDLSGLNDNQQERVKIGAIQAAKFIKNKTPFNIREAEEVGDKYKSDSNEDADIAVRGQNGQEKLFSLKLTSQPQINVRNTLASKISEDIFGRDLEELLNDEEMNQYQELTQEFVENEDEFSSSDLGGPIKEIFTEKFREAISAREDEIRKNLLKDMRVDSNMVATKVTKGGNFKGFVSPEREVFRKFENGEGNLEVKTRDSNNTSIFFTLDGEDLFRIDMYGQYNGSTRKPRVKSVYRVLFGDTEGNQNDLKDFS